IQVGVRELSPGRGVTRAVPLKPDAHFVPRARNNNSRCPLRHQDVPGVFTLDQIHLHLLTIEWGRGGSTAGLHEGLDAAAERGHVNAARVDLPALGVTDLLVTLDSGRREPE